MFYSKIKEDFSLLQNGEKDITSKMEYDVQKMPHNIQAEQTLLGAILFNNENLNKVADILSSLHFFLPIHQKIYHTIQRFIERSLVADPMTLRSYLSEDEIFKNSDINCFDYLVKLTAEVDMFADLRSLSILLQDLYVRRKLIEICQQMMIDGCKSDIDLSAYELLELAERRLFDLAIKGNTNNDCVWLNTLLANTLIEVESIRSGKRKIGGIGTGFTAFDKMTGGLQCSDLIIIASRPSMGKTSFAVNIAYNTATIFHSEYINSLNLHKEGKYESNTKVKEKTVAIFSLEMSAKQLANRIFAIATDIDSSKIYRGDVSVEEFTLLSRESSKISELPIFIDDSPALTISAIRTRARRLKRQHNVNLIIIDYLQLIRPSKENSNINRVQEIAEISQGLKALAKELDIPVIALSQLSRAVETRVDKHPQLSDLRESGNIEQDADIVVFLYRESYYLSQKGEDIVQEKEHLNDVSFQEYPEGFYMGKKHAQTDKKKNYMIQQEFGDRQNVAEIIISKHRNGPTGVVNLYFDPSTTKFTNKSN